MFEVKAEGIKPIDVGIKGIYSGETNEQSDHAENNSDAMSYIKNRTHYTEVRTGELNIEFDGEIGNREAVLVDEQTYYVKISDAIPTREELEASTATLHQAGNDYTAPLAGFVTEMAVNDVICLMVSDGMGFVIPQEVTMDGATFAAGTWTIFEAGVMYTKSIYLPSLTYEYVKKLDNKFIDAEWMASPLERKNLLLEEAEREAGRYGIDFPAVPQKAIVTYNGERIEGAFCSTVLSGLEAAYFGNLALADASAVNTGERYLLAGAPELGHGIFATAETSTCSVEVVEKTFPKIPHKYLPDYEVGFMKAGTLIDANLDAVYANYKKGYTIIFDSDLDVDGNPTGSLRGLYMHPQGETYAIIAISEYGCIYRSFAEGWRLLLKLPNYESFLPNPNHTNVVMFGEVDKHGVEPVPMNDTLTEGSELPAKEGAVYTAVRKLEIQFDTFKTRVSTATELLETTLNGSDS